MTGSGVLLAVLTVQGAMMAFDELYFHRKRGLGRWERVGHPLDTLTMVACLGWVLLVAPSRAAIMSYAALATFSCVFVTKDEWVHARHCSAGEHWVHALLFLVHPMTLAAVAVVWPALHGRSSTHVAWIEGDRLVPPVVMGQLALAAAFCVYQAAYWNLPWRRASPGR